MLTGDIPITGGSGIIAGHDIKTDLKEVCYLLIPVINPFFTTMLLYRSSRGWGTVLRSARIACCMINADVLWLLSESVSTEYCICAQYCICIMLYTDTDLKYYNLAFLV